MNFIELFSGSKIMTETFNKTFNTLSIDNNEKLKPDLCVDILNENPKFDRHFHVLWASPPCQSFSVASIYNNWIKDGDIYTPKNDKCRFALKLLDRTIEIISVNKPLYWFIENPRGMMRKIIDDIFKKHGITDYVRHTVTYCQYGDTRMKPTDIWTNCKEWNPREPCKNGMSCHVSAPRGSCTGTQGLKNAYERGKLPRELCEEVYSVVENIRKKCDCSEK